MDAWILDESPGEYRWGSIDTPEPGPGEVRVRPVTSALNHMDHWLTRGLPKPTLPHVPGCDVAGVVDAVGEGAHVEVGAEVVINPAVPPLEAAIRLGNDSPLGRGFQILGEQRWGGHADGVVVPAWNVVPKPENRSWEECAAFPLATLTAYRMLRRARLTAGETVIIVGIGGGVSMAALGIALAMGAEVYVTSREQSKIDQGIALGAAGGFRSDSDEPWPVKAQVVVESVGPATWEQSMRSLVPGGRLVVCGGTSGQKVEIDLPKLFFKQIEIIGSTMGSHEEFDDVVRLVELGLPIAVDEVFDRADYPKALERLRSGAQLGKVVLRHPS